MKRKLLIAFVALTLSASAVWLLFRADLAAAKMALESASQIAATACGPIEYRVVGRGPPVLLVHGAGGGYSQMDEFSQRFAAAGFRAIAVSRFGYLRTPLPRDGSPVAQADAHACLLDALDVQHAATIGLSAGAPSAIQFCALHAERCSALVLLVPAIAVPGREVKQTTPPSPLWQFVFDDVLQSDIVIWSVSRAWPELMIETVLATPLDVFRNASQSEKQRALGVIRDVFPVSLRSDGLGNDAAITTSAPTENLQRIVAPTLAISARDDLYDTDAGAAFIAEHVIDAKLILLSQGGHAWLGHNERVQDEVIGFLRTVPAMLAKDRKTGSWQRLQSQD